MTDTATTFAVGDRVQVQEMHDESQWAPGIVTAVNENDAGIWYEIDAGNGREIWAIPKLVRHIDVEPEAADDAAVSASVAGSSPDDGSGAGAPAEPAAEESPVPTVEELAAQVAALTQRVKHLETIAQWQRGTNEGVLSCLEMLGIQPSPFAGEPPYRTALVSTPRTTRRIRKNITKNTKGYQHEVTAEVASDDPTIDVNKLSEELLELADLSCRFHIIHAEYRDQHGLPGDDEIDPDRPF